MVKNLQNVILYKIKSTKSTKARKKESNMYGEP